MSLFGLSSERIAALRENAFDNDGGAAPVMRPLPVAKTAVPVMRPLPFKQPTVKKPNVPVMRPMPLPAPTPAAVQQPAPAPAPVPGNTGIVPPGTPNSTVPGSVPVTPATNGPQGHAWGRGGMGMGGGFGNIGQMLSGLQLPSDMTASQLLSKLQGMDWNGMREDYRDARHSWNDAGRTGSRPTFQSILAGALGGTYSPTGTQTPIGNIPSSNGPPIITSTNVVQPTQTPAEQALTKEQQDQQFYLQHGYYPGG